MGYCAYADLKKLIPEESLVQLTDDEGVGKVNQARIDEAIAQADTEIDAYLGTRYSVPFATVPTIVGKLSVDMTIYHLYSRRVEEIPKTRADRYKDCLRLLEGIAAGKISIGEAAEPEASASADQAQYSSEDRIFTRDKLKGF